MGKPLWSFVAYRTAAGGMPVQDWYDGLAIEERELIQDRVNYLANLERNLWSLPYFGPAGDPLWEIRKDTKAGWLRVYGVFDSKIRHCFVLLNGSDKDRKNDKTGKKLALDRFKLLKQKIGDVHEFNFEREPLEQSQKGLDGQKPNLVVKSVSGDRFSNSRNKR